MQGFTALMTSNTAYNTRVKKKKNNMCQIAMHIFNQLSATFQISKSQRAEKTVVQNEVDIVITVDS